MGGAPTGDERRAVSVGAFDLVEPIGIGGMAWVWAGRHRDSGARVAVKVLNEEFAEDARLRTALRQELRAVAALEHPGVVLVLDSGDVTAAEQTDSGGTLRADTPWLAMELASGGTLGDWRAGEIGWPEIRGVLDALLEAMAHAHARGVIHRDVKPTNVLLCTAADDRPGAKLTDFGIAHVTDPRRRVVISKRATPHYAPPESLLGNWRDFGPWTDLYSLGCVGWRLVTGTPPFARFRGRRLVNAHMAGAVEPLQPRIDVPIGLSQWLRRLVAPRPCSRYQTAAAALHALRGLGEPVPSPVSPARAVRSQVIEVTCPMVRSRSQRTTATTETAALAITAAPPEARGVLSGSPRVSDVRWPLPPTWRLPATQVDHGRAPLVGAGLGLFGLRTVPFVGRERERDTLWAAFREVAATGRARLVVISGASGSGKTRLGRWMAERAHEVSGAACLTVVYGATPGPLDGLGTMVRRFVQGWDLDRGGLNERFVEGYPHLLGSDAPREEAAALTELVAPAAASDPADGVPHLRLGGPRERYCLLARFLERLAAVQPVVVLVDNGQWGPDAVEFLDYVQTEAPHVAALLVLTVQEEALREAPAAKEPIARLTGRPGVRKVLLSPLAMEEHAVLVRNILPLRADLASALERRTAGNPLFAVQLLTECVRRGVLRKTPQGFALAGGASVDLPDDLRALWSGRVEAVLAGRPESDAICLERASLMGHHVANREWLAACAMDGVVPGEDLVGELVDRRLAHEVPGGWAFVHGMLGESLGRRAEIGGRLRAHHRSIARAAAAVNGPDWEQRAARHWLAAGDLGEAWPLALTSLGRMRAVGDQGAHADLVRTLEAVARDRDLDRERLSDLWFARGECRIHQGEVEAALDAHQRAAELVGLDTIRGTRIRLSRGMTLINAGRLPEALALHEELRDRVRDDLEASGRWWRNMGILRLKLGDLPGASEALVAASAEAEGAGNDHTLANVLLNLCTVEIGRADYTAAEAYIRRSLALFEGQGSRIGLAMALNSLAEVMRLRGQAPEAIPLYERSRALYQRCGSPKWTYPQVNLGQLLAGTGQAEAALPLLRQVAVAAERVGHVGMVINATAASLWCFALLDRWDGFDRAMEELRRLFEGFVGVDRDYAQCAEAAGRAAAAADELDRARAALSLAHDQWRRLGRAEAEGVRRALDALGDSTGSPPR